ncbi:hypothetical protein L211DRAFT_789661 [Terfezia boudieri ATCC MYA-4762]|uniref:TMEM205-like domain-containing protein n=1 Tax=Terfezia boudieri ATCC MYA-4762 TaxID=1051890 RepID=A0A3N4LKB8_9PEZI|nr:hypothetical protein L211DRAFT_789661 [Terfezia boudieri ATCC MYA-4762]
MPFTNSIYDNLGPAHILIFGASFGSQLYQSFISGPISYSTLPRQQFSHLQARTFPIYFALQTLSAPLLLLTLPRGAQDSLVTLCKPSENPAFNTTVFPILVAFVTSAANMLVVGPMAGRMMEKRRKVLEELEKGVDGGVTKELGNKKLKELGKAFGRVHGISTVLNLVGVVAVGVVGWEVGKRLH